MLPQESVKPLSASASKPSFWQEWRALLVFGAVFASLIVGIYFWTKYQYTQAIDPVYETYLGQLANASKTARGYQDKYFQHVKRSSVASQDFLMVCAGMTQAAKQDGIEPTQFSTNLAALCENEAVYINRDFF